MLALCMWQYQACNALKCIIRRQRLSSHLALRLVNPIQNDLLGDKWRKIFRPHWQCAEI